MFFSHSCIVLPVYTAVRTFFGSRVSSCCLKIPSDSSVLFTYFFDLVLTPTLTGLCSEVRFPENLARALSFLKVFMNSLTHKETRSHIHLSVTNHSISRTFSHIFIYNYRTSQAQKKCAVYRKQAAVTLKVSTKLSAQERQSSRSSPHWPTICMCKVVQTGVSIIVWTPQFQVSSLLEGGRAYKQVEERWTRVDQIVTSNVRLEIRIWGFQFAKRVPKFLAQCEFPPGISLSEQSSGLPWGFMNKWGDVDLWYPQFH